MWYNINEKISALRDDIMTEFEIIQEEIESIKQKYLRSASREEQAHYVYHENARFQEI